MSTQIIKARAFCTIRHERDYCVAPGKWERRVESEERVGNILTDAGRVTLHTYLYGTAAQRTSASLGPDGLSYIGLSDDGTAPAAGDTSLTAELAGDGLTRAAGTVTLPTGPGTTTTIEHEFVYTGIPTQTVQKTALFDAASGGNMAHEILFTQRTLNTNDYVRIIFEIEVT